MYICIDVQYTGSSVLTPLNMLIKTITVFLLQNYLKSWHHFLVLKFNLTELKKKQQQKNVGYKYILYKKLNSGPALILYITVKTFYSFKGMYILLSLVSV